MKQIIITIFVFSNIYVAYAENDNNEGKNKITVSGALTSCDTWQIETSYHYMFCPYFGLGTSVGMWKQYTVDGVPKGQGWRISEDYEKTENLYLRPSINIVSPPVIKFSDSSLGIFMEPGFMMNIPYSKVSISLLDEHGLVREFKNASSDNGRWYAFDCKIGLNFHSGNMGIYAGYMYSNLDIYAMRRNIAFEGIRFDRFYPRKQHLHGGFLSVYYIF